MNFSPYKKYILVFSLVFLVSSCAMIGIIYRFSDWIIAYNIGQYVDLNDAQEDQLDVGIDQFMKWHKASELPKYSAYFRKLARQVDNPKTTKADMVQAMEELRIFQKDLIMQVTHALTPLMMTLTPKQIADFEKIMVKEVNEGYAGYKATSEEDARKALHKSYRENFKDWLGRLTPEQEKNIKGFAYSLPLLTKDRLDSRASNQRDFFIFIKEKGHTKEEYHKILDQIFLYSYHPDEPYTQKLNITIEMTGEFVFETLKTLTPDQKKHLKERLNDFADEFDDIIASK